MKVSEPLQTRVDERKQWELLALATEKVDDGRQMHDAKEGKRQMNTWQEGRQ